VIFFVPIFFFQSRFYGAKLMVNQNIFIDEEQDSNKEDQNKKTAKRGVVLNLGQSI
jgi:hypothetical protein